jgi:hypothetical protein
VGASTDAARARVLAARGQLEDEVARLEAAGRAAVDIPAKVRREPARTAGLAAGAAFLVAGGPRRVIRRVRRAIQGPEADLPKSMLPKEVDRELTKLGRDGDKVRGTLEREFAKYLDEHRDERESRDLGAVTALLLCCRRLARRRSARRRRIAAVGARGLQAAARSAPPLIGQAARRPPVVLTRCNATLKIDHDGNSRLEAGG